MTGLWQDIRRAVRSLAAAPGFAAVAAATLALAIGGTTAVFSVVDAVLLRSLPFGDPDRIVALWLRDDAGRQRPVTQAAYDAWRERSATLEGITSYNLFSGELIEAPEPVRLQGEVVSANFFEVMGVQPLFGRGFHPDEEGGAAPMVLSHQAWQGPLRGDPEILGKTLLVDDVAFTVVGVAPPGFHGPLSRDKHFWTTYLPPDRAKLQQRFGYNLFARLRPGVSPEQAERELASLVDEPSMTAFVQPISRQITGDYQGSLSVLMAAVLAVLLIGCLNLAQLQLARAERQTAEFAARKALGAGMAQLFRQALAQSLALAALGGALGVALAYWLLPALLTLAPNVPRLDEATIDWRALGVAVALTAISGCLFGSAPAWRLARTPVAEILKRRERSAAQGGRRCQTVLLGLQVALSMALLAAAGSLGRRLVTMLPTDPGFNPDGISFVRVGLNGSRHADPAQRFALMEEIRRQVAGVAGVEQVALANNVPFGYNSSNVYAEVAGERTSIETRSVSPAFFTLMQIPLTAGRLFDDSIGDRGVIDVVVNQALARKLAPQGDALGQTLILESPLNARSAARIVGVAAEVRSSARRREPQNEMYLPFSSGDGRRAYVLARSSALPASALGPALFDRVRAVAPTVPLEPAQTLHDLLSRSVAEPRFHASLVGVFSFNALLLASIGVFGSVAYALSSRRRELGVRAAVGASPEALARAVVSSTVAALAIGLVLGIAAAVALGRALAGQIHDVAPYDPAILALSAAVLALSALAAAAAPAHNASRVDPIEALRHD